MVKRLSFTSSRASDITDQIYPAVMRHLHALTNVPSNIGSTRGKKNYGKNL